MIFHCPAFFLFHSTEADIAVCESQNIFPSVPHCNLQFHNKQWVAFTLVLSHLRCCSMTLNVVFLGEDSVKIYQKSITATNQWHEEALYTLVLGQSCWLTKSGKIILITHIRAFIHSFNEFTGARLPHIASYQHSMLHSLPGCVVFSYLVIWVTNWSLNVHSKRLKIRDKFFKWFIELLPHASWWIGLTVSKCSLWPKVSWCWIHIQLVSGSGACISCIKQGIRHTEKS